MNREPVSPNFACPTCLRRFARLEHLQRHTRRHTKEKPYECHCGKAFARQDLLKRHTRLAHKSTNGPSMPCTSQDSVSTVGTNTDPERSFNPLPAAENVNDPIPRAPPEPSAGSTGFAYHEAALNLGCFADIPMIQDFGMFTDTMGFMGVDLVESSDTGQFLHYGMNMSFADARATLNASHTPAPHVDHDLEELKPLVCPWRVSGTARQDLLSSLSPKLTAQLPSCLSLNRYCTGYFSDFQSHIPILHKATFDTDAVARDSPELLLAVAAIGAVYRYRDTDALSLLRSSLEVIIKKVQRSNLLELQGLPVLQSLLLLEYLSTYQQQDVLKEERLIIHKELLSLVRRFDPATITVEGATWSDWVHQESATRSYLAAFCILNTQSVFQGSPPEMPSSFVKCALPSSTIVWDAPSAEHWAAVIAVEAVKLSFQDVLRHLFSDDETFLLSPFGCFVLLHGILQRTYHLRQLSFDGTLSPTDLTRTEDALARWKRCWKRAPESLMDPRSQDASVSFQSISYLMTSYLRLGCRQLPPFYDMIAQGDHQSILAKVVLDNSTAQRSDWRYYALLHSAHLLMIVVRAGIEYNRKTLSYYWDPQHVLSWVEGAISLAQWLMLAAKTLPTSPLTEVEVAIISWVRHIVKEALPSLGEAGLKLTTSTVDDFAPDNPASVRSLAYGIIAVWSSIIPHSNNPWPVVESAGNLLERCESIFRP